ncbi:hypothetical protein [Flavobacterium rhizosphaerae]|uniref:Peptidase U49 n=1 Tax=Flavobacterium rhizosphaerae TaxID=3163298 RepID=A0ABW8YV92_9FLAO
MNYNEHYSNIKSVFQELDLVKESEFSLFKDSISAQEIINLCIQLSENASKKLNINLNFGVVYSQKFNACAKTKNNSAVIIFNLGLIDKQEAISSDSAEIFASLSFQSNNQNSLNAIVKSCCITYLFYHELAHVLHLLKFNSNSEFSLQEKYSNEECFEIRNHIYEIDADRFGASMAAHLLLEKIMNSDYKFETMLLFNTLTLLLFSIGNTIIEFSGNQFQNIYYKENSHPHPYIRIVMCNEQILSFFHKNINASSQLLELALQRAGNMIKQITYSDGRKVDYEKLFSTNEQEISNYIDEIENLYDNYTELTKHKAQQIFNSLSN